MAYYLKDSSDVELRSDHLYVKTFLEKNTKVNNWAVEISLFKIKFQYIQRIKNILADTMICLIDFDPAIQLECEECGYHTFDSLPGMETKEHI